MLELIHEEFGKADLQLVIPWSNSRSPTFAPPDERPSAAAATAVHSCGLQLDGVPRAGKDWDTLATAEFVLMGWVKVRDAEGSTYLKTRGSHAPMLTIYIDDLVIGAPSATGDDPASGVSYVVFGKTSAFASSH